MNRLAFILPLFALSLPLAAVDGLSFTPVEDWGNSLAGQEVVPCHGGAAVAESGLIYISTDSPKGILVYQPDGKLLKTIAEAYSGCHSLWINKEDGVEYLYAAWLKGAKALKMKLDGTVVLTLGVPEESGLYPGGKGYKPTSFIAGPDGSYFVADGYGKSYIHKFDKEGKYLLSFGGRGTENGKFNTCHGMTVDRRGEKPLLLICDRNNNRIQHFDFDGKYVDTVNTVLRRPCTVTIQGDLVAVPELGGRVSVLDKSNQVLLSVGDNPDQAERGNYGVKSGAWTFGVFNAPHGISWDGEGNLIVTEWNATGRVTKLLRNRP